MESEFFDRSYVELFLVKRDHGPETAVALFNYSEEFIFSYSELRSAATLLSNGWSLERIRHHAVEEGCAAMPEEITESAEALHSFQSGEWEIQKNKQRFHTDLAYAARQLYNSHAFILPTEIRNAAQYLTLGGSPNHVPALAMPGSPSTGSAHPAAFAVICN